MMEIKEVFKKLIPDNIYLKRLYKKFFKRNLNLKNPTTFNEKLQWLKLYDRKDIYTTMVDKYEVKEYVKNIMGKEYVIPTIGIYNKFEEIDFDKLPKQFVIKCTHDSGSTIVCKDKSKFNIDKAKKKIEGCLNINFFYAFREWPYKNVKPRIIIEKYIEEENKQELKDYKFFCFDGEPKFTLICSERFGSDNMKKTFFDENWKLINLQEGKHPIDATIEKPINFEKMKEIARQLSKDIPFLRVDLYETNKKIYFGEITFYPNAGFEQFEPVEFNKKLGDLINIDKIKDKKQ